MALSRSYAALLCALVSTSCKDGASPSAAGDSGLTQSGAAIDGDEETPDASEPPRDGRAAEPLDAMAGEPTGDGDAGLDGAPGAAPLDATLGDGAAPEDAQDDSATADETDATTPPACAEDCRGHGSCLGSSAGASCACDPGYTGRLCDTCSAGYARSAADAPCLAQRVTREVRSLAASATCAEGVHLLLEGVDANLDGSLEQDEVTSERTTCRVVRQGNVLVTNTAELESLRGVTELTGSLTIRAPYVNTLEPLSSLVSLGGGLVIDGTNSVESLSGLGWLDSVGAGLDLRNNARLKTTAGLTALRRVGGSLQVQQNALLEELDLGPLQVLDGDLSVRTQPLLTRLTGTRLRTVVGALNLVGAEQLASLEALASLRAVGKALQISGCHALTHLRELAQLEDVGALELVGDRHLTTLDGLAGLRVVRGTLSLRALPALRQGLGASRLGTVLGHLELADLPLLADLGTFAELEAVGGSITITNTGLTELRAFPALTRFGGVNQGGGVGVPCDLTIPLPMCSTVAYATLLSVTRNPALRTLGGFPRIMDGRPHAITSLTLSENPVLAEVRDLPFTEAPSGASVQRLPALRSLPWLALLRSSPSLTVQSTGLEAITMSGLIQLPQLAVEDNPALTQVELPELTRLQSSRWARNAALVAIRAPKLVSVVTLIVDDNDALTSLPTLPLGTNGGGFGSVVVDVQLLNNGALRALPNMSRDLFTTIRIVNNDALIDLSGLRGAGSLGGTVVLDDNDALASLATMAGASFATLRVTANDALTDIAPGASVAASTVELRDQPALRSIAGLAPSGSLTIVNDDALVHLDGLVMPASRALGLRIDGNATLNTLRGLDALTALSGPLSIQDNPALPECAAQALSARLTGSATRTIRGNDASAACP